MSADTFCKFRATTKDTKEHEDSRETMSFVTFVSFVVKHVWLTIHRLTSSIMCAG